MSRIKAYIKNMQKRGASHSLIKQNLLKKGYHIDEINSTTKKIHGKRVKNLFNKLTLGVVLIAFFFFLIYLSITTNSELVMVLTGFFPSFLSLVGIILILEHYIEFRKFIWLVPIPFLIIFFYIGYIANVPILQGMELNELIILNIIFSYIFVVILGFVGVLKGEDFIEKLPVENKNVQEHVYSIEEKCEAINRVIGRVFKNKSGGTAVLRTKIKINKSSYNELSLMLQEGLEKNKEKVFFLVNSIEEDLKKLLKNHIDLLGYTQYEGLSVKKDDSVLNILIKNDKDPIQRYFDSALEFCYKLKSDLRSY